MVNVKGRWALLTGASRGIGYQIALFMAKQGCNLILQSRDSKHSEDILQKVQGLGVEAYAVACDLYDMDSVERMLDEIEKRQTVVDIILNNAGMQVAYREDYFNTPIEDYDKSMRINFYSLTVICKRLMPKMIERGFGRVVNTSSGIADLPEMEDYAVSKAAVDKYTRDLASKLQGTDVIISLTDPDWCRTDLGGPDAPNTPESTIPGIVVGAFVDDKISGRMFRAQEFKGMELEEAVKKAHDIR